jgi:hypothetical protein
MFDVYTDVGLSRVRNVRLRDPLYKDSKSLIKEGGFSWQNIRKCSYRGGVYLVV